MRSGSHVEPAGRRGVAARARAVRVDRAILARAARRRRRPIRRSRSFSRSAGPGLHHITLRVDDIDAALAELRAAQRPSRSTKAPRRAPRARRVAFIHPSSAQGVLVELKQVAVGRRRRPSCPKTIRARRHRHRDGVGRLLLSRRRRDVRRGAEDVLGEEGAARRAEPHPDGDALHPAARRADDADRCRARATR